MSQSIAANVRAELARRGLTQQQAGEAIGLTQKAMSRRLTGEVEFSASELQRVAGLLELPTSALYGEVTEVSA